MAALLANAVQRFIIAHEAGHHVLGHGVGTRGFLTGQRTAGT
jgi:Zn-dependent protease with chaperone function